jgi:hypothetical protein
MQETDDLSSSTTPSQTTSRVGQRKRGAEVPDDDSRSDLKLNQDAAVLERSFGDTVAFLMSLDSALLNGVELRQAIQLTLLAPAAAEVVILNPAGVGLTNDRI